MTGLAALDALPKAMTMTLEDLHSCASEKSHLTANKFVAQECKSSES